MKTRISIFGSYDPVRVRVDKNRSFELRASFPEFQQACIELGRRLAQCRVVINVCSDVDDTADYYVAQGFLDAAKGIRDPNSHIQVFRPINRRPNTNDTSKPVFEDLRHNPEFEGLIKLRDDKGDGWNVSHLRSLKNCDSVIILGGLANTYAAGSAAVLASKRLVPIASFGGASARLLDDFKHELNIPKCFDPSDLNKRCSVENDYSVLNSAVDMAIRREPPRVFMIHGHSEDWKQIENMIKHDAGLTVVDMETEGRIGETMPQRFDKHASSVAAAIAVVTPDDVGRCRKDEPWQINPRGRQNVWLEVGWFWGRLSVDRVLILIRDEPGTPKIEIPSDLGGLDVARYSTDPTSARGAILRFLKQVAEG